MDKNHYIILFIIITLLTLVFGGAGYYAYTLFKNKSAENYSSLGIKGTFGIKKKVKK